MAHALLAAASAPPARCRAQLGLGDGAALDFGSPADEALRAAVEALEARNRALQAENKRLRVERVRGALAGTAVACLPSWMEKGHACGVGLLQLLLVNVCTWPAGLDC